MAIPVLLLLLLLICVKKTVNKKMLVFCSVAPTSGIKTGHAVSC